MAAASTIPYQLRPHKAIERNLFINILKKFDRYSEIDIYKYRYVGFGAPFLEDFKSIHLEFGIVAMDCIEYDELAYSRQIFNNPYYFIKTFKSSSTEYITGINFKRDKNQIIWLDFASPKEIRQQLQDVELLAGKMGSLDILKLTFNANINSFISSHYIECKPYEGNKVLDYLKSDATYQLYLPETILSKDIVQNFPSIIRAMAIRAIKRGLAKSNDDISFNHISSFDYADGQMITTMTGIIAKKEIFETILRESGFKNREFYQPEPLTELITGNEIYVPAMTVLERMKIDKLIPITNIKSLAKNLGFFYGINENENLRLLEGYCRYYKYLPYYSKVIY